MAAVIDRLIILIIMLIAFVGGGFFFVMHNRCVDFSVLEQYNPGQPTLLLDDEGNEWGRFQLDRRDPIKLEQMPKHLIQAFMAAEDWNFFNHGGISWKGIVRSTLINLYNGRKVQGASTITQQLVRLLFFDAQKTFSRKIKEQVVAILVEMQFSKEQILETYLNHVFFGCGIYGVEAACQRFWGKHAWEINVDEAAVLAGIMRSPNRYCPLIHPESAQKRRNVILNSMRTLHFITQAQYDHAKNVRLTLKEQEKDPLAPHLKEMIRLFMEDLVGKKTLYSGGLMVQTTLNSAAQRKAQSAFKKQFEQLRVETSNAIDGALISLDVKSGDIKALIGGFDFVTSKFNRATQAKRQMGSTFKPLVYAAALERGVSFADTDVDEPFEFVQPNGTLWKPNNANEYFSGRRSLAWALSTSNNIIAIKTFLHVGAPHVIALAKQCRLQGPFQAYPSLALGCVDATLKEVAGMFNVFANDGVYVEPHYITWIKDAQGKKIWRNNPIRERIVHSRIAGQVSKVLEISLNRVRDRAPEQWIDSDAISKTGTTNDWRSSWFTGSTPELTTAIYVGRDDNMPMGENMFARRTALPIWIALNRDIPIKQKKFLYDPSLKEILIDERTGYKVYNPKDPYAVSIFIT